MSTGVAIGLSPRLVMPWQPPTNSAMVDARPQPAATDRLDLVVAEEVLVRAIEGEETARRALFDAHVDRVFRLAYRMTSDVTVAEDITQDVFARVFDRLHQFRGEAPFGAWLHRVAVTTILNALRKSKVIRTREAPLEEARYAATRTDPGLEPDLRDRVRQALAGLPASLRMVVLMFDVEGYSHEEIAEALAITPGASRVRLSRARDALRSALGVDAEEWRS